MEEGPREIHPCRALILALGVTGISLWSAVHARRVAVSASQIYIDGTPVCVHAAGTGYRCVGGHVRNHRRRIAGRRHRTRRGLPSRDAFSTRISTRSCRRGTRRSIPPRTRKKDAGPHLRGLLSPVEANYEVLRVTMTPEEAPAWMPRSPRSGAGNRYPDPAMKAVIADRPPLHPFSGCRNRFSAPFHRSDRLPEVLEAIVHGVFQLPPVGRAGRLDGANPLPDRVRLRRRCRGSPVRPVHDFAHRLPPRVP